MINEKVVVSGFGGQGVMLVGQIMAYIATDKGLNTLWFPSYGPETRGGTANCSVTISEKPINSPVIEEATSAIIMNKPSLIKFNSRIISGGHAIINSDLVKDFEQRDDVHYHLVDANSIAVKLGNIKIANMVMLGAYIGITKVFTIEEIKSVLVKKFTGAKASLIDINIEALKEGINVVS